MPADEFDKRDEDKDLEIDLMAEQELLRLTRQYRVMEGDKEAYLEEATKFLRRQRQNIQDLETTKELLRGLKSSCSNMNSRKDSENAKRLDNLLKEQDSLSAALQQERLVAGDLETHVQRIERQIAIQRKAASVQRHF